MINYCIQFSIVKESLGANCFPLVFVPHTYTLVSIVFDSKFTPLPLSITTNVGADLPFVFCQESTTRLYIPRSVLL
jgi:hypothetical protein